MRCTGPLGYALSGSAVLALLAGCSGGGSSSSPTPLAATGSQPQSVSRSLSSLSRQGPQSSSVLRPGVAHAITPDLSAGFAEVDAATKAAVIISDAGTNDVYVYSTAGKLTATITGFTQPQGLGGDAAGDLYVANTSSSDILVYPNTYKK